MSSTNKKIINPNYSLKTVNINEMNFSLDPELRNQGGEITLAPPTIDVTAVINKSKKTIEVHLGLRVDALIEDKKFFNISVKQVGTFAFSSELPMEDIRKFSSSNAPAIIFPTLRSVVSVMTMSSNLPPLQLQLINFHNVDVEIKELE